MIRFLSRASFLAALLILILPHNAFSQEIRVIRVGGPVMRNGASRSVPGEMERDRLVKALNDEKTDKKLKVRVEGVPLEGNSPQDVASQAEEKRCDYVVYTTLVELNRRISSSVQAGPVFTNRSLPHGDDRYGLGLELH